MIIKREMAELLSLFLLQLRAMETNPVRLTRKELYGLVWSNSMTALSKRFGTSDNGLDIDIIAEGIDEIEFQFKEGQAYGYRDIKSKIVYFKTVFSNDMLKGDRLNFQGKSKETLDQLYELFKWNT